MDPKSKLGEWADKLKSVLPATNRWNKIPNFIEALEKGLEKEFQSDIRRTPEGRIPLEDLPIDPKLRDSGPIRKVYESIFPVSHLFRVTHQYGREFLDQFMPLSQDDYLGRGSYKFVYSLPWNQVVKVGKSILPSDPVFGSLYKEVQKNMERYLKKEELDLMEFFQNKTRSRSKKEEFRFKFARLGLERYHYWKLKMLLPDLVLPTRHFMGIRYRNSPLHIPIVTMTPCDNQPLLPGKHMKEFIDLNEKVKTNNPIQDHFFPKWRLQFDSKRFGDVKKSKLKKIALDLHRVIEATRYLAKEEKLIFDVHSENIIITLPDFSLRIFDYHVFDDYLYEPSKENPSPEIDHIELIEEFIKSFELSDLRK